MDQEDSDLHEICTHYCVLRELITAMAMLKGSKAIADMSQSQTNRCFTLQTIK